MSEKHFDFCAKWDISESQRFLDALKRKKTGFCERNGLPVPAFDKAEDFFAVTEMMNFQNQGKENESAAPLVWKGLKMELKPCKRCGGKAELCGYGMAKSVFEDGEERIFFTELDGYTVSCENCTETTKLYQKPGDAVQAWDCSKNGFEIEN